MPDPEQIRLRRLPEGSSLSGFASRHSEREWEVTFTGPNAEFSVGAAVEMEIASTIFLAVVRKAEARPETTHLWLDVEHVLDRRTLSGLQALWKTPHADIPSAGN